MDNTLSSNTAHKPNFFQSVSEVAAPTAVEAGMLTTSASTVARPSAAHFAAL